MYADVFILFWDIMWENSDTFCFDQYMKSLLRSCDLTSWFRTMKPSWILKEAEVVNVPTIILIKRYVCMLTLLVKQVISRLMPATTLGPSIKGMGFHCWGSRSTRFGSLDHIAWWPQQWDPLCFTTQGILINKGTIFICSKLYKEKFTLITHYIRKII